MNIYGVYDMSGGAWEYVSAYVDNATAAASAPVIINAKDAYYDSYLIGTTDNHLDNYLAAITKFGDAVYETSSTSSFNVAPNYYSGWFWDNSYMPETTSPWFARGGLYKGNNTPGLFAFWQYGGGSTGDVSFRPVLLVGANL